MIKNLRETRASYDNLISAIASWYDEFKIMLKSYFETHDCDGIDIMDGNIKWMDDNDEVYSLDFVEVWNNGNIMIKATNCFNQYNEISLSFYDLPIEMQKQIFDAVVETMEELD